MDTKKSTILIVDDEKQVIELLVTHFRRRNYETMATVNPAIVEQALQTYQVHLIVLDLRMERRSGYEILESLRRKNIQIPILIMTAYLEDERARLNGLGITDDCVIKKPFKDFAEAEALINRALNRVVMPGEVGSEYEDKIYRRNKAKVMIVDDELEIAEFLGETLESKRYGVAIFNNGQDALEHFKARPADVHIAIIDIAIPKINGYVLIREMLRINPKVHIIPISGVYAGEVSERLKEMNFPPEKLVQKPFDLDLLVEQIKVMAASSGLLE